MLVGETTFVWPEIVQLLTQEGLRQGSSEFHEAVRERFMPIDMSDINGQACYIESPEYNPKKIETMKEVLTG